MAILRLAGLFLLLGACALGAGVLLGHLHSNLIEAQLTLRSFP
jgi:hypothetical protein